MSENGKDPYDNSEGLANQAISSAMTKATVSMGRAAGKSDTEIVGDVLGGPENVRTTGWQMLTVGAIMRLCEMAGMPMLIAGDVEKGDEPEVVRPVWTGHAMMAQGYINHPICEEYVEFTAVRDKTVQDVLNYLLKREELTQEQYLAMVKDIDVDWFKTEMLPKSLNGLKIARSKHELFSMTDGC